MTQQQIYQMVTDRILETMKQGIIPWHRPWTGVSLENGGAISYITRQPYSILNQMLVGRPGEYLTYEAAKKLGGNVKKGEKASIIVAYDFYYTEEPDEKTGEKKLVPHKYLGYKNVFHIDQCEGIASKIIPDEKPERSTAQVREEAEKIISGYLSSEDHPAFHNDQPSNSAFYSLTNDSVTVPMISQYAEGNEGEYYSTVFHELGHSTGKKSRLNRTFGFSKSDPKYAYEELVAEITAAILCNKAGVDTASTVKNTAAYLQGWMRACTQDPNLFIDAATKSDKAARYILGLPLEHEKVIKTTEEHKERIRKARSAKSRQSRHRSTAKSRPTAS